MSMDVVHTLLRSLEGLDLLEEDFDSDASSSSDEPFSSPEEMWNPNDLIPPCEDMALEGEDLASARHRRNRLLLEMVLDLEKPVLNNPMVDFLLEDGVCEELLSFVVRLNPSLTFSMLDPTRFLRARDLTDLEAVKRSFRCMELLTTPSKPVTRLVNDRCDVLLCELFRSFSPDSDCNFHHFKRILAFFLRRHTQETLAHIISHGWLCQMLNYLHEPPVVESILAVLKSHPPREEQKIRLFTSLVDVNFLDILTNRLSSSASPHDVFSPAADFFLQLVEQLAIEDNAEILFHHLVSTNTFVEAVVATIINRDESCDPQQQQECCCALHALLLKSKETIVNEISKFFPVPLEDQEPPVEVLPNMLRCIRPAMHEQVATHLGDLCRYIVRTGPVPPTTLPRADSTRSSASASSESGTATPVVECVPVECSDAGPSVECEEGSPSLAAPSPAAPSPAAVSEPIQSWGEDEPGSEGRGRKKHRRGRRRGRPRSWEDMENDFGEAELHMTEKEAGIPHEAEVVVLPTYQVKPLTVFRLKTLEVIVEVVSLLGTAALNRMPREFWIHMVRLFFEYNHNNMLHTVVCRLFDATLKSNHVFALRALISEGKMLSRMIDYFQGCERSSALRGHILLLGNMLRLTADMQGPDDYVRNYLASHKKWREFLPQLREETMCQTQRKFRIQAHRPLALFMLDDLDEEEPEPEPVDEGIDLGSTFAKSLGFDVEENDEGDNSDDTGSNDSTNDNNSNGGNNSSNNNGNNGNNGRGNSGKGRVNKKKKRRSKKGKK